MEMEDLKLGRRAMKLNLRPEQFFRSNLTNCLKSPQKYLTFRAQSQKQTDGGRERGERELDSEGHRPGRVQDRKNEDEAIHELKARPIGIEAFSLQSICPVEFF